MRRQAGSKTVADDSARTEGAGQRERPAARSGEKPPRPHPQQPEFAKTALFSASLADRALSPAYPKPSGLFLDEFGFFRDVCALSTKIRGGAHEQPLAIARRARSGLNYVTTLVKLEAVALIQHFTQYEACSVHSALGRG